MWRITYTYSELQTCLTDFQRVSDFFFLFCVWFVYGLGISISATDRVVNELSLSKPLHMCDYSHKWNFSYHCLRWRLFFDRWNLIVCFDLEIDQLMLGARIFVLLTILFRKNHKKTAVLLSRKNCYFFLKTWKKTEKPFDIKIFKFILPFSAPFNICFISECVFWFFCWQKCVEFILSFTTNSCKKTCGKSMQMFVKNSCYSFCDDD